jgi:hypothetical protein
MILDQTTPFKNLHSNSMEKNNSWEAGSRSYQENLRTSCKPNIHKIT